MSRLRGLLVVVLVILGMLVLLAGPAAAASRHSAPMTITCGDANIETTFNLRSGGVTSHVVGSTQRAVGLAIEGERFIDGVPDGSFSYEQGRGPDGRVQGCDYSVVLTLPDDRELSVVGTVRLLLTPARR